MELILLGTDLKRLGIIDVFDSLIWTDRYFESGDFEIITAANIQMLSLLQEDRYLMTKNSEHLMVIESIELKTDEELGNHFVVKGRSVESILERRIVWTQTLLSGTLQAAIKQLLNENAISPTDPDRKIENLVFEDSTDDAVALLPIDIQLYGETLYDVISALCEANGIGFKITLSSDNQFVFKLYAGVDRSYSQLANPYVAFSPDLENLTETDYFHSKVPFRSITLVVGEGEGTARQTAVVSDPSSGGGTGLSRREKFTDASDVSKTTSGGTLTTEQYNTYLVQRGLISLSESVPVTAFDGKIDYLNTNYVLGQDYFLGDIVQIANEYGLTGQSRVEEIVFSEDKSGFDIYPTFKTLE